MRQRIRRLVAFVSRGGASFLAAFTLLGLVGELRGRTLDVSLWWLDLGDLPAAVRIVALAAVASLLAAWAVSGVPPRWLRLSAAGGCLLLALFAARDVVGFYNVLAAGTVRPAAPIPLSALIALGLLGLTAAIVRGPSLTPGPRFVPRLVLVMLAAAGWAILFPLAQMLFFGTTDYRRPADAAVVFGARVYATGRPSPLLEARIMTAVELYRAGLVPVLIMSGGDGADGFNEARVMRDEAVAAGVDPGAILVDPTGNTTEATVTNAIGLLVRPGSGPSPRVIAVSQPYHLPRVQLTFARGGIDALTVPAADPEPVPELVTLALREVLAFWSYDLRTCLG